jgi:tetratricopeptide (TPR) repeat protein
VVPRQLPATAPAFTGRAVELADLDHAHDMTAVVITAIDGMAGIGKTALAVHAAHALSGHYPDGQIFLDLHGYTGGVQPVEPGDALERILRALGVPGAQVPPHLDDRAALYRSELVGRKMLILLDNVAGESQVEPLVPGTPGCLVLVTSRRRLSGLDRTHTVSLDLLPPPDAVALFTRAAGEQRLAGASPELLAEVVELCGRLPLAIRIAAARLRSRSTWTVANLVDRLEDHRRVLTELEDAQRSVTAALDLSYLELSPDSRRTYQLCGLHPGADIDAYGAAALVGCSAHEAERLIADLLDAHLLHEPAPGRYRFHDLVRAHAAATAEREDDEPARRDALTRLFDHYCQAASEAMDVGHDGGRPRIGTTGSGIPALHDPAEAGAWLDGELPNLLAVARHAAEHGWPDQIMQLSATLHRHLRGRARYADAETLHNAALGVARSVGNRPAEQAALIDLGNIDRLLSRFEQATDYYTRALAVGHHAGEVRALIGLGHVHRMCGRHGHAVDVFERAREIAREAGDLGAETDALTGLGWLHRQMGRYGQAIEGFERAREIARITGNRRGELDTLIGLGWLHHYEQSRPEEAGVCFRQALDIARAIGNPLGELHARLGLGEEHRLLGQYEQAADHYRRMLSLAREIGNPNTEFEALHGMGRLHHSAGRPDQALASHSEALDIANDLGQPTDVARTYDGLAHAHRALGQPERARECWRRALEILAELGTSHTDEPDVTTTVIRAHLQDLDQRR